MTYAFQGSAVVTVVLVIGVLNLCLGFALAVYLERPLVIALPKFRRVVPSLRLPRLPRPPGNLEHRPAPIPSQPYRHGQTERAANETLPADWIQNLKEEGIEPASPVEAVLWILRLALPDYQRQIAAAEHQIRFSPGDQWADAQFCETNQRWTDTLGELADRLSAGGGDAGPEGLRCRLEDLLLDQSFEVKSAGTAISAAMSSAEPAENHRAALRETYRLFDTANALRDRVDEMLATTLRDQSRLHVLDKAGLQDPASQVYDRLGLEVLFDEWFREDADRVRLVSAVLVDLDRLAKLNERFGSQVGDRTVAAFGKLLGELVRRGRGVDRVARFTGQSFFLFLGNTACGTAASGAERIRQTVEAMSFQVGPENAELTVSCAVAEMGKTETLPQLFQRLQAALAEAKRAGRNRTCVDEGEGPRVAKLPQYGVQGRVIQLAAAPDLDT